MLLLLLWCVRSSPERSPSAGSTPEKSVSPRPDGSTPPKAPQGAICAGLTPGADCAWERRAQVLAVKPHKRGASKTATPEAVSYTHLRAHETEADL
eukprot:1286948-Rhodomonas_salina.1